MIFAIVEHGSHQHRVEEGQQLLIDYQKSVGEGDDFTFDRVLLANGDGSSQMGKPTLDGATVAATVVTPLFKGPKLEIQKIRRRKNSRRHTGHRQKYTLVEITSISVPNLEVKESDSSDEG